MSDDLVARLLDINVDHSYQLRVEAADRIKRLEAGLRRIINAECRYGTIGYHMRETADQALGEWEKDA